MTNQKYLVYKRRFGKAIPEIWYGDITDGNGKIKQDDLISRNKIIGDDVTLSLNELEKKYPCKEIIE